MNLSLGGTAEVEHTLCWEPSMSQVETLNPTAVSEFGGVYFLFYHQLLAIRL